MASIRVHDPEMPADDPFAELNVRQRDFVRLYCGECRGNALQAAAKAGYNGSPNTLGVMAHDLLKNPKVQRALAQYLKPYGVTTEVIVKELSDIIRGRFRDVFKRTEGPDGSPHWEFDLSYAMESGNDYLLKKVTEGKDGRRTIELQDRLRAIELAGRYLRMWGDRFDDLPAAEEIGKMNREQVRALLAKIG